MVWVFDSGVLSTALIAFTGLLGTLVVVVLLAIGHHGIMGIMSLRDAAGEKRSDPRADTQLGDRTPHQS